MLQTVGLLKSQASARHLSSCATTERVLNQHRAVIIAMTARTAQTNSTAVQSFLLASLIIIINCPLNRNSNTVFCDRGYQFKDIQGQKRRRENLA